MIGWLGDISRFWWGLFYWNIRKSWFRLRGAHRDDCPCQNVSDSGLAFDTRCDAIIFWSQPGRFRRVCPLLKETPDGWRCSVEAEGVRPFWGRAGLYVTGALLALYFAGTVVAYTALRTTGYDLGYLVVAWPPRWAEIRGSQERLYAARAQQALKKGDYQEAILSLEMVCQLNPHNYGAALALAGLTQVAANPSIAEHIYERLMHDVPENRIQTAQIWFRNLLGRGAYDQILPLAAIMLGEDPGQRGAWLNALLFAARQTHDPGFLAQVLQQNPHLPDWCTEIIELEKSLLEGRVDSALPRLNRIYRPPPANYVPYYQVETLLHYHHADEANALLDAYGDLLQPDESAFLRLRIYQAKKWTSLVSSEFDNLLQFPMAPRIAAQFCAYLLTYPAPGAAARYYDRFARQGPPLNTETMPLYQATYLVLALADDTAQAEEVRAQIARLTSSDARVLRGLVELLKAGKPDPRLSRVLPLVPLPIEVMFAILKRQSSSAPQ